MSDLIINIRIGLYHFQLNKMIIPRFMKNEAHRGYPDGFFSVYQFPFWR